jgi:hypothetical protein
MHPAFPFSKALRLIISWFERFLALTIFMGAALFTIFSAFTLHTQDWSQTDTVYDLINRVLLVVIVLELMRTLLTHELEAILELLAFVVARKTLKPDLSVLDILLSVAAFVLLFITRFYFARTPVDNETLPAKETPAAPSP